MASRRLSNYLRTNRKRLSLSQEEVAHLLGVESGAKVCRHEKKAREPSLRTALAYEAIFQKPVKELFAGLYQKIEQQVAGRAKTLSQKLNGRKSTRQSPRKRDLLSNIADPQSKKTTEE